MAAPANLPPPPPPDSFQLFLSHQAATMNGSTLLGAAQLTDPNGLATSTHPPPLPPPSPLPPSPLPPTVDETAPNNIPTEPRERSRSRSRSSNHSGSDGEDSDDEEREQPHFRWRPIEEDKSAPCEDELAFIESQEEHSALDHAHWENLAFFDLDDPELVPGAQGRIDWLVESFNGTKESPNKEHIMRSPTVNIGGYDWRIKFFPRGNDCEFLSVYIECVDMQSPNFEEDVDFDAPPFPFLTGTDFAPIKKRISVAAQLSVVMYNPAEPRVYEGRTDAHQYSKSSSDYGFKYFSREMIRDFHTRRHLQRQAILRDDKLAFSAYIRIVQDSTGSMWQHNVHDAYTNSIRTTGLRPFAGQESHTAALVPLMHLGVFRDCLRATSVKGPMMHGLLALLLKMFTRKKSRSYGLGTDHHEQCDVIWWLRDAAKALEDCLGSDLAKEILGSFDSEQGAAVAGNRLRTKDCGSVQEAIDRHPTPLATPKLLTAELERQEFDRSKRRWKMLTNRVEMSDTITVSGIKYYLFAFLTFSSDLRSNKRNCYVRPGGSHHLWYAYGDGEVTAMTHKQAVLDLCGVDDIDKAKKANKVKKADSPYLTRIDSSSNREEEMAYVVMYARDDARPQSSSLKREEEWIVPDEVKNGHNLSHESEPNPKPTDAPPIPLEQEKERQERSLEAIAEGSATPECFIMDGEDVVMSDADDESSQPDAMATSTADVLTKPTPEIPTWHSTIDALGKDYYCGQVSASGYHGEGHLITMSGNEYTGSFRHGLREGHGKMIYSATGNIYEGEWAGDEHDGRGKLTEAATGNVFEGGWKEGKKHGDFVLTGKVTDEDKGNCSICYDKELNTVFYDCGHVVACKECAERIDSCPVCRKKVLHRMQIYGVKMTFE